MNNNIVTSKTTFLFFSLFSLLFVLSCQTQETSATSQISDNAFPESGQEALQWLIDGNQRFVAGKSQHRREGIDWRQRLTQTQKPFATILGCSDSRVPIELIFDQGFGDLFIIRVAGNVMGPDEKGSIAYAIDHLHTPLILVLGHEGCGAVTAAMLPDSVRQQEAIFLRELLKLIDPAVENIDPSLPPDVRIQQGVEANVRWSMKQLKDRIAPYPEFDEIIVAGAVYELDSGSVRVLE